MNQLWQYWTAALDTETINAIYDLAAPIPYEEATMGFEGSTDLIDHRKSRIKWLPANDPNLTNIIMHFAREANKNAFGFIIDDVKEIQFTTYDSNSRDRYDWHEDVFWANPTAYDRKLSVIIQLSLPHEYEGGDFQIEGNLPQMNPDHIRQLGSVIVIPSFLKHRVTPVTKGVRHSLVSWIQGPKFR